MVDSYAKYLALRVQGEVLLSQEQFQRAIEPLDSAWQLIQKRHPLGSPDVAEVNLLLGNAKLKSGDVKHALDHLRAADEFWRKFDPTNREAELAAAAYAHGRSRSGTVAN